MAHLAYPLATAMRSAVRIERSMTACHHTTFSVASPIPSHVHDFTDSHLQAQRYIALLRIKKKQLKKLKLQAPCRNHWICLVFIFFDSSNLYQEPSEKLTYEAQQNKGMMHNTEKWSHIEFWHHEELHIVYSSNDWSTKELFLTESCHRNVKCWMRPVRSGILGCTRAILFGKVWHKIEAI